MRGLGVFHKFRSVWVGLKKCHFKNFVKWTMLNLNVEAEVVRNLKNSILFLFRYVEFYRVCKDLKINVLLQTKKYAIFSLAHPIFCLFVSGVSPYTVEPRFKNNFSLLTFFLTPVPFIQ